MKKTVVVFMCFISTIVETVVLKKYIDFLVKFKAAHDAL